MKGQIIICQECGKETVSTSRGVQKYCPECREIVKRRQQYESHRKWKAKHKQVKVSDDTEEMRKLCLNCRRARCTGSCDELAQLVREMKGKKNEQTAEKKTG